MSHSAPDTAVEVENQDDPVIGWTYFVSIVGILLFLVGVYFASGVWYQIFGNDVSEKSDDGLPALYELTIEEQRASLSRQDSWTAVVGQKEEPKLDANGKAVVGEDGKPVMKMVPIEETIRTVPLDSVRGEVLQRLKAGQGK